MTPLDFDRWAPWNGDGVTLHLARPPEPDDFTVAWAGCSTHVNNHRVGPTVNALRAGSLAGFPRGAPVCIACTGLAISMLRAQVAHLEAQLGRARRSRDEAAELYRGALDKISELYDELDERDKEMP